MPEISIQIGGRSFDVSCQDGEEEFLQGAAKMLDDEANVLANQVGRIPEARMLLMAGLMLADKTAAIEDKVAGLEKTLSERDAEIESLRNTPLPVPEKVEVPVIPSNVTDGLAELAAQAEALADEIEEKAGA